MGWFKKWIIRWRRKRNQRWLSDTVTYHVQRSRGHDRRPGSGSRSETPPAESDDERTDIDRLPTDAEPDSEAGLSQGKVEW